MLELILMALLASGPTGQTPPRTEAGERAADRQDKMICKRFIETGSLVRGYRMCKTKREWEGIRSNMRDMRDQGTHPSCGGDGAGVNCPQ